MIDTRDMSDRAVAHLMQLVDRLTREGLMPKEEHIYAGRSTDGGAITWHDRSLYCYTITADEHSDEIRESDGGYILVHCKANGSADADTYMDVDDLVDALRVIITPVQ